ncbi:MAG: DUF2764 family protein [Bacteroidales bacterium]
MKRNYYYLVAGLQDITLDIHKLHSDQLAFREELRTELRPDDYKLVEKLFLPFDNINLLNLLEKNDKPFQEKGNFSKERLEENIKEPADLPEYMMRFITAFKNKEPVFEEMKPEDELNTLFYDYLLENEKNAFLHDWFQLELNIKNIMVALIARKYEVPYENKIIGTGETAEMIRKSHSRDFGLGGELDYIEELTAIAKKDDVKEREQAIDELKWNYLEEETFFHYFTIEKILAFTIKLGMIERWLNIDRDHSNEMFKKLLKELQESYELPEKFTEK